MAQLNPDQLLIALRAKAITSPMVMCRAAADPLFPGARCGYACRLCGRELQVLPTGRDMIAAGGVALCNPCGTDLAEYHAKEFGEKMPVLGMSAEASAQLARGEVDPRTAKQLDLLPRGLGKTGYPD